MQSTQRKAWHGVLFPQESKSVSLKQEGRKSGAVLTEGSASRGVQPGEARKQEMVGQESGVSWERGRHRSVCLPGLEWAGWGLFLTHGEENSQSCWQDLGFLVGGPQRCESAVPVRGLVAVSVQLGGCPWRAPGVLTRPAACH